MYLHGFYFFIFQIGYRISPITSAYHTGFFECRAVFRGQEDSYTGDITVRSTTSYVPPPHINLTNARHVVRGDAFSLVCSVMVDFDTLVELTWETPNQISINEHRLTQPESLAKNLSLPGTHLKVVEQVQFSKYYTDLGSLIGIF